MACDEKAGQEGICLSGSPDVLPILNGFCRELVIVQSFGSLEEAIGVVVGLVPGFLKV